jgi:hypothetical protein
MSSVLASDTGLVITQAQPSTRSTRPPVHPSTRPPQPCPPVHPSTCPVAIYHCLCRRPQHYRVHAVRQGQRLGHRRGVPRRDANSEGARKTDGVMEACLGPVVARAPGWQMAPAALRLPRMHYIGRGMCTRPPLAGQLPSAPPGPADRLPGRHPAARRLHQPRAGPQLVRP